MYDREVSVSKMITDGLWGLVVALLLSSWLVLAFDGPPRLSVMLALTSTVTAVAAGVSQARGYTLRVCALLRTMGGLEKPHDAALHTLR